jgi:hypothetical protein
MSIPSVRPPDLTSSDSSASPSRFLQRIRKFRSAADENRAAAKDRENTRLLETLQGHLHSLDCVEAVSDRIEGLANELIAEAPGFHLARRFFDGRYMVEMAVMTRLTDADGRSVRELSRLAFLLAPEGEDRLGLECHATVRDHDLPIVRLETSMCTGSDSGSIDPDVQAFLDEQFLGFARAYYDENVEPAPSQVN